MSYSNYPYLKIDLSQLKQPSLISNANDKIISASILSIIPTEIRCLIFDCLADSFSGFRILTISSLASRNFYPIITNAYKCAQLRVLSGINQALRKDDSFIWNIFSTGDTSILPFIVKHLSEDYILSGAQNFRYNSNNTNLKNLEKLFEQVGPKKKHPEICEKMCELFFKSHGNSQNRNLLLKAKYKFIGDLYHLQSFGRENISILIALIYLEYYNAQADETLDLKFLSGIEQIIGFCYTSTSGQSCEKRRQNFEKLRPIAISLAMDERFFFPGSSSEANKLIISLALSILRKIEPSSRYTSLLSIKQQIKIDHYIAREMWEQDANNHPTEEEIFREERYPTIQEKHLLQPNHLPIEYVECEVFSLLSLKLENFELASRGYKLLMRFFPNKEDSHQLFKELHLHYAQGFVLSYYKLKKLLEKNFFLLKFHKEAPHSTPFHQARDTAYYSNGFRDDSFLETYPAPEPIQDPTILSRDELTKIRRENLSLLDEIKAIAASEKFLRQDDFNFYQRAITIGDELFSFTCQELKQAGVDISVLFTDGSSSDSEEKTIQKDPQKTMQKQFSLVPML